MQLQVRAIETCHQNPKNATIIKLHSQNYKKNKKNPRSTTPHRIAGEQIERGRESERHERLVQILGTMLQVSRISEGALPEKKHNQTLEKQSPKPANPSIHKNRGECTRFRRRTATKTAQKSEERELCRKKKK